MGEGELERLALCAAVACGEPMLPPGIESDEPPWKKNAYQGGKARHNRGGVTRKSRFQIPLKKLRAEKKAARRRKGK